MALLVQPGSPDTDVLLTMVAGGDAEAGELLLERYRLRLRQMVLLRLDRRLWSRVDPSDVVQETLAEAAEKLREYAAARPVPFYPWLRRLAWEHLVRLHETHVRAQKRSVLREVRSLNGMTDESISQLAQRLTARTAVPDGVLQAELTSRLLSGLSELSDFDREILVLRYLEQLSTAEIAATLARSEGAVRTQHSRALARLSRLVRKVTDE